VVLASGLNGFCAGLVAEGNIMEGVDVCWYFLVVSLIDYCLLDF